MKNDKKEKQEKQDKKETNIVLRIIKYFFVFLLCVAFPIGLCFMIFDEFFSVPEPNRVYTTAIVRNVILVDDDVDTGETYDYQITYSIGDNRQVTKTVHDTFTKRLKKDDKIDVYYDSNDPSDVKIVSHRNIVVVIMYIVIDVAIIGFDIAFIVSKIKERKSKKVKTN